MNSLRPADFRTMDPQDKFTTPRPAPAVPITFGPRLGTSAGIRLNHKASSRSLSPAPTPGWTGKARRLFGLRPSSRSSDRGQTPDSVETEDTVSYASSGQRLDGTRSTTPSESNRSRDLSPESLRRFLSDDKPLSQPTTAQSQKLTIPDDIVEEAEDDENFATSAVSESVPFTTLSPPPFQRSLSSPSVTGTQNASSATVVPDVTTDVPKSVCRDDLALDEVRRGSLTSFTLVVPSPHLSCPTASSAVASPTSSSLGSPNNNFSFFEEMTPVNNNFSFFDELAEDDDRASAIYDEGLDAEYGQRTFTGYSLPKSNLENQKDLPLGTTTQTFESSPLVARTDNGLPVGPTSLLALKGIDAGLDDLVSEISWIANAI
jgi:hypothetical protein